MFGLPPLPPSWDGLHPMVVHFPIALMCLAPVFVAIALARRKHTGAWLAAGALTMLLAAAGAWMATSTGSAAESFAKQVPGARAILHDHEELGEATQYFALALAATLVLATLAFRCCGEKAPRAAILAVGIAYLIANGAGMLVAANTAHYGGRLVHEVGVRARLTAETPGAATALPAPRRDDD